MILNFDLNENDALALTERYLQGSKSHQKLKTRLRWGLPLLLALMACFYTWRDGFSWFTASLCGGVAFIWWLFYPRGFDSRIRAAARKQMKESSYAKSLGPYEVELLNEHLRSQSPMGSSTYDWSGVDRVEMDEEYLYIFLSGPFGYPIRISEIGGADAQSAFDFISERIALNRADDPSPQS